MKTPFFSLTTIILLEKVESDFGFAYKNLDQKELSDIIEFFFI